MPRVYIGIRQTILVMMDPIIDLDCKYKNTRESVDEALRSPKSLEDNNSNLPYGIFGEKGSIKAGLEQFSCEELGSV